MPPFLSFRPICNLSFKFASFMRKLSLTYRHLSFLKNKRFLGNGSFCQRLRRICLFVRSFAVRSLRFFFGRSFLTAVVLFDFSRLCFDRKERFGFEMVFSSMAFFLCGIFSLLIINSSSGKVSIFPNISVLSYRSFDRICNIYPTFVKNIISYRSVLRKYFLTRSPGLAQRICAIKVLEK